MIFLLFVIAVLTGGFAGYSVSKTYSNALPIKSDDGTNAMSRCCGVDIVMMVDGYDGTPMGYCCDKCGADVDLDAERISSK